MAYKCPKGQGAAVKCTPPTRSDIATFATGATNGALNGHDGWLHVGTPWNVVGTRRDLHAGSLFEVCDVTLVLAQAKADAVDARYA